MEKKSVQVFCANEGKQVGEIELFPGVVKMTIATFRSSFVPISSDYRLGDVKDYSQATCPKCGGNLCIKVDVKKESDKLKEMRRAARDRAMAVANQMTTGPSGQKLSDAATRTLESRTSDDGLVEIIIGKMTIKVE